MFTAGVFDEGTESRACIETSEGRSSGAAEKVSFMCDFANMLYTHSWSVFQSELPSSF